MKEENQSAPPVTPNPSTPAAAGQEEGKWRVEAVEGGWRYLFGNAGIFVSSRRPDDRRLMDAIWAAHNASLREQLHGEKEPVAEKTLGESDASADNVKAVLQNALARAFADLRMHAISYHINPLHGNYYLCKVCNVESKDSDAAVMHAEGCSFTAINAALEVLEETSVSDRGGSPASRVSSPNSSASIREKEEAETCPYRYCGAEDYKTFHRCDICGREWKAERLAAGKEDGKSKALVAAEAWFSEQRLYKHRSDAVNALAEIINLSAGKEASEPNTHVLQKAQAACSKLTEIEIAIPKCDGSYLYEVASVLNIRATCALPESDGSYASWMGGSRGTVDVAIEDLRSSDVAVTKSDAVPRVSPASSSLSGHTPKSDQ